MNLQRRPTKAPNERDSHVHYYSCACKRSCDAVFSSYTRACRAIQGHLLGSKHMSPSCRYEVAPVRLLLRGTDSQAHGVAPHTPARMNLVSVPEASRSLRTIAH